MNQSFKSVSLYRYDILENGLADEIEDWSDFIQTRTEYANDGRILKETTFGHWGEPDEVIEYLYDENLLLIEEKHFHGEEEPSECILYERDINSNITREVHQFFEGGEDITEYQYNDQSQPISKIMSDSDGELERKESFEYEGKNLICETVETGNGNLITKNSYVYNEAGLIKETEQYSIEEGKSERIVSHFDDGGNRIKTLKYNYQEKLIEITRYIYKDNLLQEIEDENQKGKSYIKLSYDDKGNVISQEEINDRGQVISTIERSFGDEGRLLQATVFIDGMNYRPNQHYILRYTYEIFD